MAEVDTLSSSTSADALLTADGLFLEITRLYDDKTASAFTMYLNLDSEDRGEVRGQMKQMLKSNKYTASSSGSPFPTASDKSAV